MSQQTPTHNPWTDDEAAAFLRLRMKSFWNLDYFERIISSVTNPYPGFRNDFETIFALYSFVYYSHLDRVPERKHPSGIS
jgi:hypothetical protein